MMVDLRIALVRLVVCVKKKVRAFIYVTYICSLHTPKMTSRYINTTTTLL